MVRFIYGTLAQPNMIKKDNHCYYETSQPIRITFGYKESLTKYSNSSKLASMILEEYKNYTYIIEYTWDIGC